MSSSVLTVKVYRAPFTKVALCTLLYCNEFVFMLLT